MKKQHFLPAFFIMFFGLSVVLTSSFVAAQNAADDNKQVKVKIKQNINGESKTIEKTFSADEEDAIQELLKEFNINLNADDLDGEREVEINIRKIKEDADEDNIQIQVECIGGGGADEVRPFLGVFVETFNEENAGENKRVSITEVIPGSAAEQAGLKERDVLLKVDTTSIIDAEQFREIIRSYKPQDEIALQIVRDGKEQTVKAILKEKKRVREFHFMPDGGMEWKGHLPPMKFFDEERIEQIKDRPFLGIVPNESTDKKGVVIEDVIEKSSAQELGLQKGDVIKKLNDKPIENFDALREVLGSLKVGDEVKVEFEREGKITSETAKLGSKPGAEKMCLHFDEGKMQECMKQRIVHQPDEKLNKEGLEQAVQEMEKEIQILKKRIEMIDSNEEHILEKTGDEETTISITIEDVAPNTLVIEGLQFSPNPNDGNFNVNFELPEKGRTVVRIFDAANKEIYKEDLGKFSGRYNKQIDISDNPRGIYFLQITQNDKAVNKKIIIQ
ncbi:MAG: PDZ domain-containing protein [Chitinophagales bacterium]|nr:PDZ domain-containing protein [Chitinophagales bacterium]